MLRAGPAAGAHRAQGGRPWHPRIAAVVGAPLRHRLPAASGTHIEAHGRRHGAVGEQHTDRALVGGTELLRRPRLPLTLTHAAPPTCPRTPARPVTGRAVHDDAAGPASYTTEITKEEPPGTAHLGVLVKGVRGAASSGTRGGSVLRVRVLADRSAAGEKCRTPGAVRSPPHGSTANGCARACFPEGATAHKTQDAEGVWCGWSGLSDESLPCNRTWVSCRVGGVAQQVGSRSSAPHGCVSPGGGALGLCPSEGGDGGGWEGALAQGFGEGGQWPAAMGG